jgi:hypothetical protein
MLCKLNLNGVLIYLLAITLYFSDALYILYIEKMHYTVLHLEIMIPFLNVII